MATRSDITPELCRQLLRYEPETGKLFWLFRPREMFKSQRSMNVWNARYAGQQAFTADSGGYRVGRIQDMMFRAHRVAWAIVHGVWPVEGHDVDHINGAPGDNRLCNLRSVPHQVNNQNNRRPTNNSSGHVGVSWNKHFSRWEAYIGDGTSRTRLGMFDALDAACAARKNAEAERGYHPNHGRPAH